MRYNVSSAWAGKFAKTRHGITSSITIAVYWYLSWSILEFFRVLKLNKYHYGNIFAYGEKITDELGRVICIKTLKQ